MPSPQDMSPNRPYLIRALHEWIVDNGMTPHMLVDTEVEGVDVPSAVIQNGKVILNTSPGAVQNLDIANEWLSMDARFSGKSEHIYVPVAAIIAVYAKENGQGMMFADDTDQSPPKPDGTTTDSALTEAKSRNSHLKVVK